MANTCHRIGSLLPPEEGQTKYLQVYFLDSHAKELAANAVEHLTLDPEARVPALDFRFLVPEARHRKASIIRLNVVKEVLAEGTFA